MNRLLQSFLHLLLLSSVPVSIARRNDRNQFHGHKGKLNPHTAGLPKSVKLSSSEKSTLAKGGTVMKQEKSGAGGGAICVQDVQASAAAVWFQILDLSNYNKKVSKVKESRNYVVKKQRDGSIRIKTKQVLGVLPGYSYESYYDHTFYPSESSLTWTLDYDKTSDFDDVAGHWHVQPLTSSSSRVYYACDIAMKGAVPGPIMNYITKAALKQATAWVKKESEAHPEKKIPSEYGRLPAKLFKNIGTSGAATKSKRSRWGFPAIASE